MVGEKPTSKALQLAWQGTQRPVDSTQKQDRRKVAVVGIGAAGSSIIAQLAQAGMRNAQTIVIDTDSLQLTTSQADHKIIIGRKPTRDQDASEKVVLGKGTIKEAQRRIEETLAGMDTVIITAGLGEQTGTLVSPIVAEIAKKRDAITIGVVMKPFRSERGQSRKPSQALTKLRLNCDTLIAIDNNKLLEITPRIPIDEAFKIADKVVANTIKGLVETISASNLASPNLDDFKTAPKQGGVTLAGIREPEAPNRAEEAMRNTLNTPLPNTSHKKPTVAPIHVIDDGKMTVEEASHVGEIVTEMMSNDAQVNWGAQVDPGLNGKMRVTLVMTRARPARISRRIGSIAPQLFNLETQFEPEKRLAVDLGLYQMEDF